jgi:hypothetical protein
VDRRRGQAPDGGVLDHQGRPLARDAAEPYGAARLAWRPKLFFLGRPGLGALPVGGGCAGSLGRADRHQAPSG